MIRLARDWGLEVVDMRISVDDVITALERGRLKEAFGAGTATVITPVGKLAYRGKTYSINDGNVGPLAQKLYDTLLGIQYGKLGDPYGWMEKVV